MNKIITAASLAGFLAFSGSAFAQSAESNVVGYETLDFVSGFNFLGLRLHGSVAAGGAFDGNSGTELTDSTGDFSGLASGTVYLIELANGTVIEADGADLTGSSPATAANLAGIDAGDQGAYEIRPAATLASQFGDPAGAANNTPFFAAGSPGSADQVWVPDGAGSFNKYYVNTNFGVDDWFDVDTNLAIVGGPSSVVLNYVDAFVVSGVGAGSIVVEGDLKTAETSVGIGTGFQYLGGVYPTGATLTSQFGDPAGGANNTSFFAAGSPGSADQVWISSGGGFNKYYVNTNFGVDDWFDVDTNLAIVGGPSSVDVSSGYVVSSVGAKNVGQAAPGFYAGL